MMRRITMLVTVAVVMAAMMALSGAPAGAQTQTCPEGTAPGVHPLTGEPGCVAPYDSDTNSCPQGTGHVIEIDPFGVPHATGVCFGPFEEPPLPPVLTKEACKEGGYAALGFKQQGECIKAAKQASEAGK